jgi:uncharacterized protein (DUF983 family)
MCEGGSKMDEREPLAHHRCIICEQPKLYGIMICSEFICEDCESEMIQTDVLDEKYPFFIHQMRQIWYRKNA